MVATVTAEREEADQAEGDSGSRPRRADARTEGKNPAEQDQKNESGEVGGCSLV